MVGKQYFGTDGVRGKVGGELINPQFARRLGKAAGLFVKEQFSTVEQPVVVIGRDTRGSGTELAQAVAEGLASCGFQCLDAGVVPTPAVAQAVLGNLAHLGVVITASHNPASDNGIKFFKFDGFKLSDEEELAIENLLDTQTTDSDSFPPVTMEPCETRDAYIAGMVGLMNGRALMGWRIALDTANGATFETSRMALEQLGAEVYPIGDEPDGQNINEGIGSEHPEVMAARVLQYGAKIGIAHDGDGDRLVLCDEKGEVLDGDEVLALCGLELLRQDSLQGNSVVATVMSNLGLDEALEAKKGKLERVGVGDRNVVQRMRELGAIWGGESSGHFVNLKHSTTGDGLLAALIVMQTMLANRKPLSELRKCMRFYPQMKKNIAVSAKPEFSEIPGFKEALTELESSMERGRILLRYSGTEPKIRLLVEVAEAAKAEAGMQSLEALVREYLPMA